MVPLDKTEDEIKALFDPVGKIKSFFLKKSDKGQYGYVCYDDETNKEHGPQAVNDCIDKLNGLEIGENKMTVEKYISKEKREVMNFKNKIQSKQQMKHNSIYVTGFPLTWTEVNLKQVFGQFGEITSVKVGNDSPIYAYAFICFATPENCQNAR